MVAGFTENDTFSNQIREGILTREEYFKRLNRKIILDGILSNGINTISLDWELN